MARTIRNKKTGKRKSKRGVVSKSTVRAIAKDVIMKTSETKSAMNEFSLSLKHQFTHAFNLVYFMNQGTTATKVLGEKIFLKNIHIKGYFVNSLAYKSFGSNIRVCIVRTKEQIAAGTLSTISSSSIFRSESSPDNGLLSHVDLHKVDLLYDKTFKLGNNQLPTLTQFNNKRFNKTLKINKEITWDSEGLSGLSGYLKDKNIYIIFQAYEPGSLPGDLLVEGAMNYSVNYKDF